MKSNEEQSTMIEAVNTPGKRGRSTSLDSPEGKGRVLSPSFKALRTEQRRVRPEKAEAMEKATMMDEEEKGKEET